MASQQRFLVLLSCIVIGVVAAIWTTVIAANRAHSTRTHAIAGILGLSSVALVIGSATLILVPGLAQETCAPVPIDE